MFRGANFVSSSLINSLAVRCISRVNLGVGCKFLQPNAKLHINRLLKAVQTVNVPPFPESISEGDINWKKNVGDTVVVDEVVGEIETDKTAIPVMSPISGVVTELLVEDGGKVIYDQPLIKIDEREVSTPSPSAETTKVESKEPQTPATVTTISTPKSAAPAPAFPSAPAPPHTPAPASGAPFSLISAFPKGVRTEQRVKMTRIRLRTADRLKEAQTTCAILTTFNEIDMSNLIEMRKQYNDAFAKKHGIKLGIMSSFSKAAAFALQDQPIVNAYIDGKDIVYRNYVDISIAVASPKGLVVPVLRNVETMDFAAIERGIFDLGEQAKSGILAIEDMDGGTFTISNGGVFGSLFSTPIVNPPQSAILGLHGTFERPVARNGQVVVRPMMYVALSYDHRLIDGREAVLFLRKIKSFVEDPRVFFLGM